MLPVSSISQMLGLTSRVVPSERNTRLVNGNVDVDVSALAADPPPSPRSDQILVAVQPYRFRPGAASDLKKLCPTSHTGGKEVPVFDTRVAGALPKSTWRLWLFRSMAVWP